jgi:hypothetical protein
MKLIHTIENHPTYNNKYSYQVTGKSSWNGLLDRISNYSENVIVLLTSNTNYDQISNDKSFLIKGRIDIRFILGISNCEYHSLTSGIFSI